MPCSVEKHEKHDWQCNKHTIEPDEAIGSTSQQQVPIVVIDERVDSYWPRSETKMLLQQNRHCNINYLREDNWKIKPPTSFPFEMSTNVLWTRILVVWLTTLVVCRRKQFVRPEDFCRILVLQFFAVYGSDSCKCLSSELQTIDCVITFCQKLKTRLFNRWLWPRAFAVLN